MLQSINTKKGTRAMNAVELADRLVDYHDSFIAKDCATMLRQQQSRILELEGCINDCYTVQKMQADECYKGQAEIEALKSDNDALTEALNRANRVYDFDNPLLDKEQTNDYDDLG